MLSPGYTYNYIYDYLVKSDVCIYDNVNITLISFLQISDINRTFMFIPCKMCSEVKSTYQYLLECKIRTISKHINEAHNIILRNTLKMNLKSNC